MKDKDCEGCALYNCPGPVGYEGPDEPEALFVGEALGAVEVDKRRPFVGQAGRILRESLTQTGVGIPTSDEALPYFQNIGICNIWRCRPPNNKIPDDAGEPAKFCKDALLHDIRRNPKIVVPLGGSALDVLTEYSFSITKVQGKVFTTNSLGFEILLLPMFHPAFLPRKRTYWRDWELGFDKLKMFLHDGSINYIPLTERKVRQAKSYAQALTFIKRLRAPEFKMLACDIETASYNMPWEGGDIITIALAWSPTDACAIPYGFVTTGSELHTELKALLEDRSKRFIWYNGPFDVQFLWADGIDARIDGDAMLSAYLLDERNNVHSLKRDSAVWLNASDWEESLKRFKIPNNKEPETQDIWRRIPKDELLEYNGQDTCHTHHLESILRSQHDEGLTNVYETIMIPATNMLARAKYVGMRIDLYRVKELRDEFVPILSELTQKCVDLTGDSLFNPNSSQQKLSWVRKRGFNVDNVQRETLEQFAGADEFIDALIDYSQAHKMYSTYVMGIVDDISEDLLIHPDFKLFGTETGRLSAKDPNVLGMPRKAEEYEHKWKRLIKQIFRARDGNLLAHIDQKQSEVRCAAFLSDDEMLISLIKTGRDLHSEMAKLMYGDAYTKEQRVWAKMVTFGLIYNREAYSLSLQLTAIERGKARAEGRTAYHKWTTREAQDIIDRFWRQMPRLLEWKGEKMREALTNKQLVSFTGRIRRFGLITPQNRKDVENEAVNFPPSSLSNDINLLNCIEVMNQLGKYGVEVLVPIHDAALIELPKNGHQGLLDEAKGIFEETPKRLVGDKVPFAADVTVGERWSDL